MELDFIDNSDNSDNVEVSTVREVVVSVHQEPVGSHAPSWLRNRPQPYNGPNHTIVSAAQCATVLICAHLPLQGPTVSALLLIQRTSIGALILVPGTYLHQPRDSSTNQNAGARFPANGQHNNVISWSAT